MEYIDDSDLKGLPVVNDIEIAAIAAGYAVFDEEESEDEESSEDDGLTSSTSDEDIEDVNMASSEDGMEGYNNFKRLKLELEADEEGNRVDVKIICPEASEDDDSVIEDITAQDDFLQLVACMSRETDTCPWGKGDVLPPVERLSFEISGDEQVDPAGEITAVLESVQIVVQSDLDAKVLDEGSVLCLDNRTPLGKIEDIIGPVAEPLYLLRYAGPEPMPEAVRPGARVSSVPSHSKYILQEKIEAEGGDGESVDGEFSDEDAEVLMRRSEGLPVRAEPEQILPQISVQPVQREAAVQAPISPSKGEHTYRRKLNPSKQDKALQKQRQSACSPRRPPQNPVHASQPAQQARPPPGGRWIWVSEGSEPAGLPQQAGQAAAPPAHFAPSAVAPDARPPPPRHFPAAQRPWQGVPAQPQPQPNNLWPAHPSPWQQAPRPAVTVVFANPAPTPVLQSSLQIEGYPGYAAQYPMQNLHGQPFVNASIVSQPTYAGPPPPAQGVRPFQPRGMRPNFQGQGRPFYSHSQP